MPDIYGKQTVYKGSNIVTADEMTLTIGGRGTVGLGQAAEYLVQNTIIQYNQPVNRVYEIGTSYVYFAPGRPMGSIQIGRIVGRKLITSILGPSGTGVWTTAYQSEATRTAIFQRRAQKVRQGSVTHFQDGAGTKFGLKMTGLVVESYGVQADANGLLIQENVSGQYAGLEFV